MRFAPSTVPSSDRHPVPPLTPFPVPFHPCGHWPASSDWHIRIGPEPTGCSGSTCTDPSIYCANSRAPEFTPRDVRVLSGATMAFVDEDDDSSAGWTLCLVPDPDAVQPSQSPTATLPPTSAPTVTYRDCVDLDRHHDGYVLTQGQGSLFAGCEYFEVNSVGNRRTCGISDLPRTAAPDVAERNPEFAAFLESYPANKSFVASVECCACGGGTHPTGDCVDFGDRDECDGLTPYPECDDTNNGATNRYNQDCGWFSQNSETNWNYGHWDRFCDMGDDDEFTARTMCCACGGGRSYIVPGQNCNADDATLSSTRNCCVCGGGDRPTASPTATVSPTSAPSSVPSTPPTVDTSLTVTSGHEYCHQVTVGGNPNCVTDGEGEYVRSRPFCGMLWSQCFCSPRSHCRVQTARTQLCLRIGGRRCVGC